MSCFSTIWDDSPQYENSPLPFLVSSSILGVKGPKCSLDLCTELALLAFQKLHKQEENQNKIHHTHTKQTPPKKTPNNNKTHKKNFKIQKPKHPKMQEQQNLAIIPELPGPDLHTVKAQATLNKK